MPPWSGHTFSKEMSERQMNCGAETLCQMPNAFTPQLAADVKILNNQLNKTSLWHNLDSSFCFSGMFLVKMNLYGQRGEIVHEAFRAVNFPPFCESMKWPGNRTCVDQFVLELLFVLQKPQTVQITRLFLVLGHVEVQKWFIWDFWNGVLRSNDVSGFQRTEAVLSGGACFQLQPESGKFSSLFAETRGRGSLQRNWSFSFFVVKAFYRFASVAISSTSQQWALSWH